MERPLKPPKLAVSGRGHAPDADPFPSFCVDPWAGPTAAQAAAPYGNAATSFDAVLLLEPQEGKCASRVVWAFTSTSGSSPAGASPSETLKSLDLDVATLDQFCYPDADELKGRRHVTHAVKAGQSLLGAKREAAKYVSGLGQQLQLQQQQQQQSNMQGFVPASSHGSTSGSSSGSSSSSSSGFAMEGQSECLLFALGGGGGAGGGRALRGAGIGIALRCCVPDLGAFERDGNGDGNGDGADGAGARTGSAKRSLAYTSHRRCCLVLIARQAAAGPDVAPCAFEHCKQVLYTVHGISLSLATRHRSSSDSNGFRRVQSVRAAVAEYLTSVQILKSPLPPRGLGAGVGAAAGGTPVLGSNTSAPLLPLLESLGVNGFLTLLSALLTERRVLVVSDYPSKLAQAAYAMRAMLSLRSEGCPAAVLDWHHVFIPVLPATLLSMLDAPLPFIIGLKRYLLRKVDDWEEACADPDAVSCICPRPFVFAPRPRPRPCPCIYTRNISHM